MFSLTSPNVPLATIHLTNCTVQAFAEDESLWVSVPSVCSPLGLSITRELRKLGRRSWSVLTRVPRGGEWISCLELEAVPFWLASIEERRLEPDGVNVLRALQRECSRKVRDHFRPPSVLPGCDPQRPEDSGFLLRLALGVDPTDPSLPSVEAQLLRGLASEISCVEVTLLEAERSGANIHDAIEALRSLRRRARGVAAIATELLQADGRANPRWLAARQGQASPGSPFARTITAEPLSDPVR